MEYVFMVAGAIIFTGFGFVIGVRKGYRLGVTASATKFLLEKLYNAHTCQEEEVQRSLQSEDSESSSVH